MRVKGIHHLCFLRFLFSPLYALSSSFNSIPFPKTLQTTIVSLQADSEVMGWTKKPNAITLTPKSNFLQLLETELSADGLRHRITKRISFSIPEDMISLLLQRPRQLKNPSAVGMNFPQTREYQGQ